MAGQVISEKEASLLKCLKGASDTIVLFGSIVALADPPTTVPRRKRLPNDKMESALVILYQANSIGLLGELEFGLCEVHIEQWNFGLAEETPPMIALHCGIETLVEVLQEMSGEPGGLEKFRELHYSTAHA